MSHHALILFLFLQILGHNSCSKQSILTPGNESLSVNIVNLTDLTIENINLLSTEIGELRPGTETKFIKVNYNANSDDPVISLKVSDVNILNYIEPDMLKDKEATIFIEGIDFRNRIALLKIQ